MYVIIYSKNAYMWMLSVLNYNEKNVNTFVCKKSVNNFACLQKQIKTYTVFCSLKHKQFLLYLQNIVYMFSVNISF